MSYSLKRRFESCPDSESHSMLNEIKTKRMKRIILLAMISVLSCTSFAQTITAAVTPSSADTLCNGSVVFSNLSDSNSVFIWMQQGTTPIHTFTSDSTVYNLCPGIYDVQVWSYLTDTMYYETTITILSPSTHLDIEEIASEKKLVRVLDITGKESEVLPNRMLFFLYSDGSKQRKYIIE